MKHVLVIHGPNLNLLGEREPEIYGDTTLEKINAELQVVADSADFELKILQSNHEGVLIDFIHLHRAWADGILINPAAFTHYSIALRDALAAVALPFVEVHLTELAARETFRKQSLFKDLAVAYVEGNGWRSYLDGFDLLKPSI